MSETPWAGNRPRGPPPPHTRTMGPRGQRTTDRYLYIVVTLTISMEIEHNTRLQYIIVRQNIDHPDIDIFNAVIVNFDTTVEIYHLFDGTLPMSFE